jgi:hypothetical protein
MRIPVPIPELLTQKMGETERQIRRYLARLDGIPESQVMLPHAFSHRLRLLNLAVWALRYRVDLSFILDTLLRERYAKIRRTLIQRGGKGRLGISPAALCGRSSEKYLQEHLLTSSYRVNADLSLLMPVRHLNGGEDMAAAYDRVMKGRHRKMLERKRVVQHSFRNWRGKSY